MQRHTTLTALAALTLVAAAGCAPVEGDDPASSSTQTLRSATCPESVTSDGRDPRNAAGQIRYCWPGDARCFCDSDGDCYAEEGHVACTPLLTLPATTAPMAPAVDAGRAPTPTADAGRAPTPTADAGRAPTPTADAGRAPTPTADAGRAPTTADAGRAPTTADAGTTRTPTPTVDAGAAPTPTPTPSPAPAPAPAPATGTTTPSSGLRAFPGAEGFGAGATGGRGGRVIYVTNLNASGPGSFQDAVQQTGPRYILFKVSGVINGDVQMNNGDVTIAGQTSPGGITVRGLHTTEANYCDQQCGANARGIQNFIVRHLRSRPANGSFPDGLRLRYARNGIVDHLSMGNAEDEAVEISYTNNLTIQDSVLAETLGDHAQYGGMLINYTNPAAGYALDNLTIVRNVWNRIQGRYPEFSRESAGAAAGTTLHVELTNNLYWDQRYFIDVNPTDISGGNAGSNIYYQMNWVGNSSYAPSSNHFGFMWLQPSGTGTSAYFADNHSNLWPSRADWDLNYCCNNYNGGANARPAWGRTARHPFPAVTVLPSSGVRANALANAGAFPRDPMDRRLMGYVAAGTFDSAPNNTNPANDALRVNFTGAGPAAPADTDNDGMPDAWETAHGTNPSVADHNGTTVSVSMTGVAGYTNLECYLNELAALRVRNNA